MGRINILNDSGTNKLTLDFNGTSDATLDLDGLNQVISTDSVNTRVGIGTDTPEHMLHLKGSYPYIVFEDTDNGNLSKGTITGNSDGAIYYDTNFNNDPATLGRHIFRHNGASMYSLILDQNGYALTPNQPHWAGSIGHSSGDSANGAANQANTRNSTGTLSWGGDRITVPITGIYAITFQTICANTSGRVDTFLKINGSTWNSCLSEDNGSGFHQRTHTANIYLQANDYIQFFNTSWYNTSSSTEVWQTASVTLLG